MDSLDLIRTFVAVAEAGSFTAAGLQLGKSKALVSKHVAELERRLGARLLNRTTRSVSATDIGRAYFESVREWLAELDALEDAVRSNGGKPRGLLRVTAPQFFQELEIIEMTAAFRSLHPNVQFDILLTDRHVNLASEGFELGFRIARQEDPILISRHLCDMPVVACTSPAYLKAHGCPGTPEELNRHACIVDTNLPGHDIWRFSRGGQELEVRVSPVLQVNSAAAVKQALLADLGIGLCPEFIVARAISRGELIELFHEKPACSFGVYLVYPHRLHLSAKVRAFSEFVMNWYTPAPPWLRDREHQEQRPSSPSTPACNRKHTPPLQTPNFSSAPGSGSASSTRS